MSIRHYAHAGIAGGLFFLTLSAYGAWYQRVGKESADVGMVQQQIEQKKESDARAQAAKTELDRALSNEVAIKGYFVDTNNLVNYLGSLQSLGQKFGATVVVDSVSSQPANPHTLLALALHISGPFDAVERTLGAIEYEPYDTVVTNLTLDTPGGSAGAAAIWTAAVTLRVGTADTAGSATASSTHP